MSDAAPTFRNITGEFLAYLRRPQLLAPQPLFAKGHGKTWLVLTGLAIGVLFAVLLPFIHLWQSTFKLASPEAFNQVPQAWLVPIVAVIAPIAEELLFRGWQSGTRRALFLLACGVLLIAAMVIVVIPGQQPLALGLAALALVGALAGWFVLRRNRAPLGWFARGFPVIFYLAAALFAVVHLSNYDHVSLLALPLVLPQLWAALVLGYIRQRIGLAGSIATHALSNSLVVGLALVAG